VIKIVGLQEFVRTQPNGLQTKLFPEGQKIPHTISKRILLARAFVHNPRILLLKDALEHFEGKQAREIMTYLASPERPWALIVASNNKDWQEMCNQHIVLDKGNIISKNK
jgi:ABC-type bacteriocin/lantibiotic exporter with double-glycine peptidase domain